MQRLTFVCLALVATCSAQAQVVSMQETMSAQCADELTYLNVATKDAAKTVCDCITKVQADNLTLGEYWQMQTTIMQRKDPNQLPQIKRIEPKIQQCRAKAHLSTPAL